MMSSSELVSQLPSLRRYARVLTGAQMRGDAYVAETVEAFVNDPTFLGESLKIDLFKAFTRIWSAIHNQNFSDPFVDRSLPPEERLIQLTPLPRQAFLLSSLEGFAEHEVAEILNVTEKDVRSLVDAAGCELADEIATDILIIEDEALIALDLQMIVENLGHNVIGIAKTHKEAVDLAHQGKPKLILTDIQLADGSSGIEAVDEIQKDLHIPVIYITAYPELLLTGTREEPTFLISKPFRPSQVSAIISQVQFFQQRTYRS